MAILIGVGVILLIVIKGAIYSEIVSIVSNIFSNIISYFKKHSHRTEHNPLDKKEDY